MRIRDWAMVILLSLATIHGSQTAFAEEPKVEAAKYFQRGVAAFEARRFAEAAESFETAYRLAPAYSVLFNIGQVDVALGRSVEAVDAYEKYLAQGGPSIPADRRREVEEELRRQRARTGSLTVRTNQGARIRVDGKLAGEGPRIGPLPVNPGRHLVDVALAGHLGEVRELEVGNGATLDVELLLSAATAPTPLPASSVSGSNPALTPPVSPAQQAPPTASQVAPARSARSFPAILGLSLAGVGLAGAAVGGILVAKGASNAADARNRAKASGVTPQAWDEAKLDFDAGKTQNRNGWIVVGLGTAVLAGGVVLFLTSGKAREPQTARVGFWMTGDGGSFTAQRSW